VNYPGAREFPDVVTTKGTVHFANGFTESVGKMRNDQMHGSWQWFRKDGTLKRTGAFKNGVQVGEWITYDAAGQPYRTSSFTR
jgi:antitoxin component YwqK of YwqJK toxin-antitoxin module